MAVYKDKKRNTWMVSYRVTDWNGERKQSTKRGFQTKRDALAWEREFLNKSQADLSMTFSSFIDSYTIDMKNPLKKILGTQKSILSAQSSYHTSGNAKSTKFCQEILLLGRTK